MKATSLRYAHATLAILACASLLTLSACGDDDDDSPPASANNSAANNNPANNNPANNNPGNNNPQLPTIAALVAGSEDFDTLEAAATAAGLVTVLDGEGDFTVFAPTDAAFEKLPAGTVEALLEDIPTLTAILTYHAVPARLDASAVSSSTTLTTIQGESITVTVEGGVVKLNDAIVTMTNLQASNGIVHVIDTVLIPPSLTEEEPKTITEIVVESEDFETLEAAVIAADLDETLAGEGPFTVFAPTDAAFDALPEGTLEALLADIPQLTAILTYHVVAGEVPASEVVTRSLVTTLQGSAFKVTVDGETVKINDATVTMTNIPASNGIIHVLDAVILPPKTITEIVVENEDFETLEAAVIAADLDETLAGEGPFTVFAPTDAAFDALPEGTLEALLADIPQLTAVLTFHVVAEALPASEVVSRSSVTTVQGSPAAISTTEGVKIEGANIIMTDIPAANGIIHVIDAVILPPES